MRVRYKSFIETELQAAAIALPNDTSRIWQGFPTSSIGSTGEILFEYPTVAKTVWMLPEKSSP